MKQLSSCQSSDNKYEKGFTLIEALTLLFVFSVIVTTFYSVFSLGTQHIIESKKRLGAVSIANQKMEIIRNLAYDNVGVIGGIPNGPIDPDEYEIVDKMTYHVITDIKYRDDSFDGVLGGSPNDPIPNDYKVTRVTVRWGQESNNQEVFLASTFVPPGMETSAGGGTLAINIINSLGQGIPSANINLYNSEKGINFDTATDSEGNLLLPGTPTSMDNYRITVSENGYEEVVTMPPYPETAYNPTDSHASVMEGLLNTKTIIVNLLSDIEITTSDPLNNIIADMNFHLTGGRILGTAVGTGDPIYNYDEDLTSDAEGGKSVSSMSPGDYQVVFDSDSGNYEFIKLDPGDDLYKDKFILAAGDQLNLKIILADKNVPALLVTVKDDQGGAIIGAKVKLVNATLNYDVELETDKYGMAYFPDNTGNLENDDYDISITANGFNDENGSVAINDLTKEEFILNPS